TRAGMARAKAQGVRIGRPALDPALQRKIAKRLSAGLSAYAVAKQLGIDAHTVAKYSPFEQSAAVAGCGDRDQGMFHREQNPLTKKPKPRPPNRRPTAC